MSRAYGNGFYGRRQGYLGSPEERGYLGSPEERVYLGSPEEYYGRVAGCGGGQMVGAPRGGGGGGHGGGRGGWGGWGGYGHYGWGFNPYYSYGYDQGNYSGYGDGSSCVYDQRTGRYVCYVYDPARGGWTIVG